MTWPFSRKKPRNSDRLAELEERFEFFQDLEQQFRSELESARREEDRAKAREDDVNREMFRRRCDLLTTYLGSIARVKFVIDQVRYTLRFQEGMGHYGELGRSLADSGASAELRRAFDGLHQDLEVIRRSSDSSMEKINGYLESLPTISPRSSTNLAAGERSGPIDKGGTAESPETEGDRTRAIEERLRRRLEEA